MTRTREVIAFRLRHPGLVPKHSIDMPVVADPVAAPELDMGRAGLWLLAEYVEREPGVYELHPYDPSVEPSDASDLDEVDHRLLVLEGRPGPVLQAAIEAGEVEEPFAQAFVTRRPVALSVARRWAAEATLVCGFSGRRECDRVRASCYMHEHDGDVLRFIRETVPDRVRVEELPPEWVEALAAASLDLDTPSERIVLTDVCTEVRAVDLDGRRPKNAAALEAEFREALDAPADSPDSWPEGIVEGHGFALPDDGPGRTVCLTRSRLRALLSMQPWRICLEREQATLHQGWSSQVLPMGEAEARLAATPWRALAAGRENARRSGWRRAQLAVHEWLFHTDAGRRHREARAHASDPSRAAPVEVFAVGERGVSFLGDDVASREVDEMTAATITYAWSLDPRKLRERAPQAELVLMFRRWNEEHEELEYTEPPLYLASSHDGASAIRGAVVRAGGQVAGS